MLLKKWLILTAAMILHNHAVAFTPDLSSSRLEASGKTLMVKDGSKLLVMISAESEPAREALKVAVKDGILEIDTRALFRKPGDKSRVLVRFMGPLVKSVVANKDHFMELTVSAEPAGSVGALFFEGNTADKKHFWRMKRFPLENTMQKLRFETNLPNGMTGLWLRFDCESPAVYRFGKTAFGLVPEQKTVDAGKNLITNGGAEHGWYNIGMSDEKSFSMVDGKIYRYDGVVLGGIAHGFIDTQVVHSGLRSFRLEAPANSGGRINFNPVPFEPGKPLRFSMFLKADRPGTPVMLGLFLASGIAYHRPITVGTEWKKYEMNVPVWGKPVPGMSLHGDVVNGYGAIYRLATPQLMLGSTGGRLWIDDAACHAGVGYDFKDKSPVWMRGKLSRASHVYSVNEPVEAKLELENPLSREEQYTISWHLTDFNGRKIADGTPKQLRLKGKECRTESITIKVPADRRGCMNLRFAVTGESSGQTMSFGLYLGVIEPAGPMLNRLGMNISTRQNINMLIPYLRDFRIGAVRTWAGYWKQNDSLLGLMNVKPLKKAGFYILQCLEEPRFGGVPSVMVPTDLTAWQNGLKRETAKVKGLVDAYEILNEPNIWAGRCESPDPKKFTQMSVDNNVKLIKTAAEAIHSVDPTAKIAGPTTCHTDVAWTAGVLSAGAAPYLDIITEHPYRQLPELPDYAEDLQALEKVLMRYNKKFPIYATESGSRITTQMTDNLLTDDIRSATAQDIRNILIGFGCGVDKYFHFNADLWSIGTSWNVVMLGNPGNDYTPYPAPFLFAARNLADRIGDGKSLGRIKLGNNYRCYVFERDGRRVAAIWKWLGKPVKLQLSAKAAETMTSYDFMGSKIGLTAIEISEYPVYLETSSTMNELEKILCSAKLTGNDALFKGELSILSANSFAVKVTNLSGAPLSGKITISPASAIQSQEEQTFKDIPAESFKALKFQTRQAISARSLPLEATITANDQTSKTSFDLKSIICPRVSGPLQIDGHLADWPASSTPVELTPIELKPWTTEQKHIRAEARLAWNAQYLYLGITVYKKNLCQNAPDVSAMWQGDGLQIAFDPVMNAAPGQASYQDDDYEYSAGLWHGQAQVFRHHAASVAYDGFDKTKGPVNASEVARSIKTYPDRTVYELAFAQRSLSPFRLVPNAAMRFNVIVNVNDGKERIGWLQLTPGIGEAKNPGKFISLVLGE